MFKKYSWPAAIFCLLAMACTKEMPQYTYTSLVQYSIADVQGEPLKGVIENDEIIVYWPPYLAVPDSISATITVAEKASITPASGSKVAFDSKTVYTVTAEDGSKKTFRLKPVINQPIPYISGVNVLDIIYFGDLLVITGDFFLVNPDQTKAYLVGPDNKETQLVFWSPYENIKTLTQTNMWVKVPDPVKDTVAPLAPGEYTIKVISGKHTAVLEQKLKPAFTPPRIESVTPYENVKAGDEITLKGRTFIGITGVTGSNMETGEKFVFNLVSYSKDELKIKVPANIKAGTYYEFEIKSTAYGSTTSNFWLYDQTITVK